MIASFYSVAPFRFPTFIELSLVSVMGNYFGAAPPPEVPQPGHVIGADAPRPRRPSSASALDEIDLSTSHRTPRKRKKGHAFDASFDDGSDSKMTTPTRKKLKNTSRYIFETLFQNGQDSDVTISALGNSWPLHKVYLCQSPYFNSMFSGNWVETNRRQININVPDPNVTREALHIAFGSLYRDEVSIRPIEAESLLAAASLLQLDSLIQHCEDVMKVRFAEATRANAKPYSLVKPKLTLVTLPLSRTQLAASNRCVLIKGNGWRAEM